MFYEPLKNNFTFRLFLNIVLIFILAIVFVFGCKYIHMYKCMYVWMNKCMYGWMDEWMCVCTGNCMCIYEWMHVCMFVELRRDLLLWTPSHGRAKSGWPARTYMLIEDVALMTNWKRDTIEICGQRGSRRSVLVVMCVCIHIYIFIELT